MKTIFRPNIKFRKKKRKFILSGALVALILIILIFPAFSFRFIGRSALYVLSPFLKTKTELDKWWGGVKADFAEKKALQEDNDALREKIMELEVKISLDEAVSKENEMLRTAFSAGERNKFLLAFVISRPPFTPYDTIIIDSGSANGVKEGMQVSAFGNVLIGYVTDVFDNMSKIKLSSSFGEETNVFLESLWVPAIAVGKGGENFEITLPRAINVNIGERILTLGRQPMLVGIVERIERQETDPFQKILFRLPINLQYLNQVFLLKK
jgi:cell shape-determining protein MreC